MEYNKELEKSTLIEQTSTTTGQVLSTVLHQEHLYKKKKADYKGTRRMQYINITEDMKLHGNIHLKVLAFIIENVDSTNHLKSKGKAIKLKDIAISLQVTTRSISSAISELVKDGRIKKDGRLIVLSPYFCVPYNTSDDKLFILQTWWDSDFTYDITEELNEANLASDKYIQDNTPKGV